MKMKTMFAAVAALSLALCASAVEKPAVKGAMIGQWTMDTPAALALAKKENKPVLMNFTGSDWCGWCKLMDKKVFSEKAWQMYAKDNLVLVWIDFPRDKSLVPEEIAPKNRALAAQYGVQGYPTYVILAPDGKEIGRLGASKDITPEKFIEEVKGALMLKDIDHLLAADDLKAYNGLKAEKAALEKKIEAWQNNLRKEGEAFQVAFSALDEKLEAYLTKAKDAAK